MTYHFIASPQFERKAKRYRSNPRVQARLEKALKQLVKDPFEPKLKTHKLSGNLEGTYACRVDRDLRILFEFVETRENETKLIHLLTLGSHDDVY